MSTTYWKLSHSFAFPPKSNLLLLEVSSFLLINKDKIQIVPAQMNTISLF